MFGWPTSQWDFFLSINVCSINVAWAYYSTQPQTSKGSVWCYTGCDDEKACMISNIHLTVWFLYDFVC